MSCFPSFKNLRLFFIINPTDQLNIDGECLSGCNRDTEYGFHISGQNGSNWIEMNKTALVQGILK